MATSNFNMANCSRYFVIGTNKYITQDDIDAYGWDQDMLGDFDPDETYFSFDCEKNNIVDGLKTIGWEKSNGDEIAYKNKDIYYGGCQISLDLTAEINDGYYEGACLDFGGKITVYDRDGYRVDTYEMFGNYAPDEDTVANDDWTGIHGLSRIQAKNIIKRMASIIEDLKNEAEIVFSRWAEYELVCDWRASNGETGYIEVRTRLCDEKKTA